MKTANVAYNQISTKSRINNADEERPHKVPTAAEIQAWLVSYLADMLEIDSSEVDITIPFDSYGLDSAAAVGLTGDLEDWLGCEIDPTLPYDYPTIEAMARHLSETGMN